MTNNYDEQQIRKRELRTQICNKLTGKCPLHNGETVLVPDVSTDWEIKSLDDGGEYKVKRLEITGIQSVAMLELKKGTEIPSNFHAEYEVVHVVSGMIIDTVSGKKLSIDESITFESNVAHGLRTLEDSTLLIKWIPDSPDLSSSSKALSQDS